MKLGIVVRADLGGLAWQSLALTRMLQPVKVMVIDSRPFAGADRPHHPERFHGFNCQQVGGFPSDAECRQFLDGLTHVMACESVYNWQLLREANRRGVKSYLQPNFEFMDWLTQPDLPLPTKFLVPSSWNLDALRQRFGDRIVFLPPPTFPGDFEAARDANLGREGRRRFLHVIGKPAHGDRNGTMLLMYAILQARGDFELVVKCLEPLERLIEDPRVTWDFTAPGEQWRLYEGFDALIMPRRYGGLCLPMCEALASGLPVIMPDVEPNDSLLPPEWLVPGSFSDGFTARVPIPYFNAWVPALARKIEEFAHLPDDALEVQRRHAIRLSQQWHPKVLRPRYQTVLD